MHYYDKNNGIKDFDIWFFYPFKQIHLPYRTVWSWVVTRVCPCQCHKVSRAG
jgi:hypothetical protein